MARGISKWVILRSESCKLTVGEKSNIKLAIKIGFLIRHISETQTALVIFATILWDNYHKKPKKNLNVEKRTSFIFEKNASIVILWGKNESIISQSFKQNSGRTFHEYDNTMNVMSMNVTWP